MKRFYKTVATAEKDGAWTVELDGRPIRTPSKSLMTIPSRALAEAVAAEWDSQATEVLPRTMPLTRHANTAIDRVATQRDYVIDEILAYGGTDLVCYRAEGPTSLVVRQHAAWGPLLDWLEARFGVRLTVTEGISHVAQASETLAALRLALAERGDVQLAALHTATTLLGSLVIALALAEGRLDAAGAWAAARVDEEFQIERWGEDAEAKARAEVMKSDLEAAARVLVLSAERS
jgi:chaperone required for assembly of F1-ATPase